MRNVIPANIPRLFAVVGAILFSAGLHAAVTDIASAPIITSTSNTTPVPPNLMFVLDDSGSMDWDFLPDWANDNYCKRSSGAVTTTNSASICCRNRSGSSDACMYGSNYASTGSSGRRMDVPMTNSDFNFAYYNPDIRYQPPKNGDGTSRSSMTSANTSAWTVVPLDSFGVQEPSTRTLDLVSSFPDVEWCTDNNFGNCRRNSNYFYPSNYYDTFNAVVGNPFYYNITAGEYCDSDSLSNCVESSVATGSYTYPAKIRWCSNTTLTTCQGIKNATYRYPRYPTLLPSNSGTGNLTVVLVVSGNVTASSNQNMTVNTIPGGTTGPGIITAATTANNNVDTVANNIIARIGNGYQASPKTCATSGTTRTCTITVLAPASGTCPSGAITPTTSPMGAMTLSIAGGNDTTMNRFSGSCRTPGDFARVDIIPATTSYPKSSARNDCAGTACTYAEEMTNFANWFTYYRTRMQMMKTSTSLAFSSVGDNFRVGYMSLNNNTRNNASNPGDFLNIDTFDISQKTSWYNKLFAANPGGSTPLRSALSTAGLIYGGVLDGTTFNGSTVVDPVLYSCQQNFTLLSTDGYWNTGNDSGCSSRGGAGCQLDQTSAVGNTDANAGRPYADGGVATVTAATPIVTTTVVTTPRTRVRTESRGDTAVTTGARTQSMGYTGLVTGGQGSCNNNSRRQVFNATGTATRTGTTITTITTPYTRTTTTTYSDGSTSTSTVTRTVITTNGVVTNDTTSPPVVTGPVTVSTTVSGPTTTAWVVGAPTTVVSPEATADTAISWVTGTEYDNNSGQAGIQALCVSASTYPTGTVYGTPTGPTLGAWSAISTTAPVSTTGAVTGNNVDTPGTATTVVTGPTTGTTTTTSTAAGGVSDSLADVAYYYYSTDLRADGSTNPTTSRNVGTGEDFDSNTNTYKDAIQRMSTYTLGLGIDGYMKFRSDYKTASSGDYFDIFNGNAPGATVCTWQTGGQCNWPTPSSDSQANIDDLWHAAVNARGEYFSARSPAELAAGIGSALNSINAANGAAAAATTSNPNITSGDNFLFSSDYRSFEWFSHLQRLQIDPATGNIVTELVNSVPVPKVDWEAGALLDAVVNSPTLGQSSRKIFTFGTAAGACSGGIAAATGGNLKAFCWESLTSSTEQNYFQGAAIASLPQFCATGTYSIPGDPTVRTCLSSTQQTSASGTALINFLRGDPSKEDQAGNADHFYRDRVHTLGDIISSEALYVKTPLADYQSADFQAFKTSQGSTVGMVYVAANDGMLHAFNAETGAEVWAYVPTMAMPAMFNLASMNYGNDHKYILDGTPAVGYADLRATASPTVPNWKTMLVGGLGAGGAGFYALDITDRANPAGMWEFKKAATCASNPVGQTSDCDLGLSMGNPVVTKLIDGTWVVLLTSGYNNTTPGDGKGYLYVLNAETGAIIQKIGTGVGSNSTIAGVCTTAPCPSGLGKIAAWADNPQADPTVKRVYGGDLFGNLWRFDVNNNIGAAGFDAQLLTVFKGPTGTLQPITARPELGESNGAALVMVGTGRLLGDSDKAAPDQTSGNNQSFYAIKDPLTATGWIDTRQTGNAGVSMQTVTVDTTTRLRSIVPLAGFDLAAQQGWGVDLPDDGELANTDPTLVLGTLVFTTNLPIGSACSSGGESFIYNLDFRSGGEVAGGPAGEKLGNSLATRSVVVQLPSGAVRSITRLSDTTTDIRNVKIGGGGTNPRRVSWRQLVNE